MKQMVHLVPKYDPSLLSLYFDKFFAEETIRFEYREDGVEVEVPPGSSGGDGGGDGDGGDPARQQPQQTDVPPAVVDGSTNNEISSPRNRPRKTSASVASPVLSPRGTKKSDDRPSTPVLSPRGTRKSEEPQQTVTGGAPSSGAGDEKGWVGFDVKTEKGVSLEQFKTIWDLLEENALQEEIEKSSDKSDSCPVSDQEDESVLPVMSKQRKRLKPKRDRKDWST